MTRMTPSEAFVETLAANDVEDVFVPIEARQGRGGARERLPFGAGAGRPETVGSMPIWL